MKMTLLAWASGPPCLAHEPLHLELTCDLLHKRLAWQEGSLLLGTLAVTPSQRTGSEL